MTWPRKDVAGQFRTERASQHQNTVRPNNRRGSQGPLGEHGPKSMVEASIFWLPHEIGLQVADNLLTSANSGSLGCSHPVFAFNLSFLIRFKPCLSLFTSASTVQVVKTPAVPMAAWDLGPEGHAQSSATLALADWDLTTWRCISMVSLSWCWSSSLNSCLSIIHLTRNLIGSST